MSICIFIDFDGTIVQHDFPRIGRPLPEAFEVMKELQQKYKLVLWTCREGEDLEAAVKFCKKNGIVFDGINETLPEDEFRPEGTLRRKPHCFRVIDDRNLGGFPGWDAVRRELLDD